MYGIMQYTRKLQRQTRILWILHSKSPVEGTVSSTQHRHCTAKTQCIRLSQYEKKVSQRKSTEHEDRPGDNTQAHLHINPPISTRSRLATHCTSQNALPPPSHSTQPDPQPGCSPHSSIPEKPADRVIMHRRGKHPLQRLDRPRQR